MYYMWLYRRAEYYVTKYFVPTYLNKNKIAFLGTRFEEKCIRNIN